MIEALYDGSSSINRMWRWNRDFVPTFIYLEKEHNMYNKLRIALSKARVFSKDVRKYVMGASSTRNYPKESVVNVLLQSDSYNTKPSYWSSVGHAHPDICESILFKLDGSMRVITDINIRPYLEWLHQGNFVHSARSVRFRMGYARCPGYFAMNANNFPLSHIVDEHFNWGYTSAEFPMEQIYGLQRFTLPEPVLCLGGFLKIELLGMVQQDPVDNMYYHRIGVVNIYGHSLTPGFKFEPGEGGILHFTYNTLEIRNVLRKIPLQFVSPNTIFDNQFYRMFLNDSTQAAQVRNLVRDELFHAANRHN
ncbi:F-box protein At4g00755-like [Andrographis paniculata]|uniref:F-box protein At4g00755-like n=1 Tax=Andrographis paniculata TaxID=175694 RepID=UPI0021E91484|nr:F-box protein At4g00755-like [Andrographis paniculata]